MMEMSLIALKKYQILRSSKLHNRNGLNSYLKSPLLETEKKFVSGKVSEETRFLSLDNYPAQKRMSKRDAICKKSRKQGHAGIEKRYQARHSVQRRLSTEHNTYEDNLLNLNKPWDSAEAYNRFWTIWSTSAPRTVVKQQAEKQMPSSRIEAKTKTTPT